MKPIPFLIALLSLVGIASAQTKPATQPLRSSTGFVIGVFSQPLDTFPKWTAQGVNTFCQWETSNQPLEWWAGMATEAGASTIRVPSTQPTWEAWDSTYASPAGGIAWALPDEPDGNNVTPAALATTAAQYRAVMHGATTLPVWLNIRGGSVNGMQPPPSPIGQYLAAADWIAEDFYPITGWNDPTKLLANGQILDQLATLAPTKPRMCFIECSNQQLPWIPNDTCVTPAQMRCEIWDAVIHGAYGIIYFPQQIGGGFSFDARPANIVAEMVADNTCLKDLQFESGTKVAAASPFEACLRSYKGQPTYVVLNTSATAATLPTGQSVPAMSVVMLASNPFATTPPPVTQPTQPTTTLAQQVSDLEAQTASLQSQVKTLTAQLASANALAATYNAKQQQYYAQILQLRQQIAAMQRRTH